MKIAFNGLADHVDIKSVGYKITLPTFWKTHIEKLSVRGYQIGPWIGEAHRKASEDLDQSISIDGKSAELKELVPDIIQPIDRSLCYVNDMGFSKDIIVEFVPEFTRTNFLFCEASFLHEDRSRAAEKEHLTTKQAALLATLMQVDDFRPFHFSNIYGDAAKNEEECF